MANKTMSLEQIAELLGVTVHGDPDAKVSGIATLQSAKDCHVSFLANPVYEKYLAETKAGAVLIKPDMLEKVPGNALVTKDPYLAYARLSCLMDNQPESQRGIHSSASVDDAATVHETASIGPGVVIEAGAMIGANAIIGPNSVIGQDSQIGEDTRIAANVSIYHAVSVGKRCIIHAGVVIGSDGFGIAPDSEKGGWSKIAQLGGVTIGDDVEIGANTAIDRGALDNTIIEDGVKLDNLIQIAHNVRIGQNTAIAACSAIAGSTSIGKNCILGGASGVAGHLTIADNVHITAMTMVIKSLPEAGVYSSGTGVQPNKEWRKSIAHLRRLDSMSKRLKSVEKRLADQERESD